MDELKRFKKYKRVYQEMAYTRDEIAQEIRSSDRNRREHLILCYIFSKSNSIKHWKNEIQADFMDIADRKWINNNKYLPEKDYYSNLWNKPYENNDGYEIIDKTVKNLIREGYKIPKNWNDIKDDLVLSIKNLYKEISLYLSNGTLEIDIIYDLIDKHIIK
jgi:hypothetical protein